MHTQSLPHHSLIGMLACVLSIGSAHAAIQAGGKVTVPFNSKSDKAKFVDVRGAEPDTPNIGSAYHSKKGIGETGGIIVVNVGTANRNNDIAVYYAPGGMKSDDGKIILKAGQTISMGIDFKVNDPDSAATPRLGLISLKELLEHTQDGKQLDIQHGKETLGGGRVSGIGICLASPMDKEFNIINSTGGKKVFSPDTNGPYKLKQDGWYQYILKIYKKRTTGKFDVLITLNQLNQSGKVSQRIGQHSATLINPQFYKNTEDGALAGFTFTNNPKGHSGTVEYDNFHIEIQKGNQAGNVLVKHINSTRKKAQPHPASYSTLIGIGGISIVIPK